jgi:hypothetical protein
MVVRWGETVLRPASSVSLTSQVPRSTQVFCYCQAGGTEQIVKTIIHPKLERENLRRNSNLVPGIGSGSTHFSGLQVMSMVRRTGLFRLAFVFIIRPDRERLSLGSTHSHPNPSYRKMEGSIYERTQPMTGSLHSYLTAYL